MRLKYSCTVLIIGIIFVYTVFCVFGAESETKLCREFLAGYGWETEEEPKEIVKITIPDKFDDVYKNYNIIQKEAGLDLLPYGGSNGKRYTYVVKNYPLDVGEPVYANVICIDGRPVAGDIMTVSMSGFMHSLLKK